MSITAFCRDCDNPETMARRGGAILLKIKAFRALRYWQSRHCFVTNHGQLRVNRPSRKIGLRGPALKSKRLAVVAPFNLERNHLRGLPDSPARLSATMARMMMVVVRMMLAVDEVAMAGCIRIG